MALPDQGEVVEVHWVDAAGWSPWMTLDEATELAESSNLNHWSVGYLLAATRNYILLAQSRASEDAQVSHVLRIPRGCVRTMSILKAPHAPATEPG